MVDAEDEVIALEYKSNLRALDNLRRDPSCARMPFKELVRQLDMADGGHCLSCLPSGDAGLTWGQLAAPRVPPSAS